jgi:hypothetical protein
MWKNCASDMCTVKRLVHLEDEVLEVYADDQSHPILSKMSGPIVFSSYGLS